MINKLYREYTATWFFFHVCLESRLGLQPERHYASMCVCMGVCLTFALRYITTAELVFRAMKRGEPSTRTQ